MANIEMSKYLKQMLLEGLETNKLIIYDEKRGKSYALYNEINLWVGGKEIVLMNNGKSVASIKTEKPIELGDSIELKNVIGFAEFSIE